MKQAVREYPYRGKHVKIGINESTRD
jgi:hypothetical protein